MSQKELIEKEIEKIREDISIELPIYDIEIIEQSLKRISDETIEEVRCEKKEESYIPDCENCGDEGYGKAWYGKGYATGDAWGDSHYPTGSVVLCKQCMKEIREWDGEEIWKWTSDLPEHNQIRINSITEKLPKNIGFNEACDQQQDNINKFKE